MISRLTLYTRAGCHLCERAEDLLAAHAVSCRLVDVDADTAARENFGLRVPVLAYREAVLLEGRIEERELLAVLKPLQ